MSRPRLKFEPNPCPPPVMFNSEASAWMTINEAADYLRVSRDTIERLMTRYADGFVIGKLRATKIVGINQWRIVAEDVYSLLPLPDFQPITL